MILVLLYVLAVPVGALQEAEQDQCGVVLPANHLEGGAHGVVEEEALVAHHLEKAAAGQYYTYSQLTLFFYTIKDRCKKSVFSTNTHSMFASAVFESSLEPPRLA